MVGIVSYGGYIPRYRLDRKLILKALGWMAPGNAGLARGHKAVAGFDEDSITMAVAAGADALKGLSAAQLDSLSFASTCLPFKERINAGIIKEALGLRDDVGIADFSSGIKAGTTALLYALKSARGDSETSLVCCSDTRLGKPASPQEMLFGDAAAAFVVGDQNVIAEFKGSYCTAHDFVDHFRGEFSKFDRQWEDRWIRDMGIAKIIPEAVTGYLEKQKLQMSDFDKVIYPCHYAAARKQLNKVLGITAEMEQPNLQAEIGETGTPHALMMLIQALESAKAGDNILLLGFGNGCDVLHFQATDKIDSLPARKGVNGSLADMIELDNYIKYLAWRNILPVEAGLRSEEDLWTRWSALWRKRKEVLGLEGSRCTKCGTPQYPAQRICVNKDCGATDEMEPYRFADKMGKIASFTGDNLAASMNPPAIYGQIEFDGGGKYMFDFVDCKLDAVKTGIPVRMTFRRKYQDNIRGISGYFWKAALIEEET